jgi:hypothetical protein
VRPLSPDPRVRWCVCGGACAVVRVRAVRAVRVPTPHTSVAACDKPRGTFAGSHVTCGKSKTKSNAPPKKAEGARMGETRGRGPIALCVPAGDPFS